MAYPILPDQLPGQPGSPAPVQQQPSQPVPTLPPTPTQAPVSASDDQAALDFIQQHLDRGESEPQILEGLRNFRLQRQSQQQAAASGFHTVAGLTPDWWAQNHPGLRQGFEAVGSVLPFAGTLAGMSAGAVGGPLGVAAGGAGGGALGSGGITMLEQILGMEPYDPTKITTDLELGALGGLGGGIAKSALGALAGGSAGRLGTLATSPWGRMILRRLGEHVPYIGPYMGDILDVGDALNKGGRGEKSAAVVGTLASKLADAGTGKEPPISPAEGGTIPQVPNAAMNPNQFIYGQTPSGQGVTPGPIGPSAASLLWARLQGLGL